jgi:hypothetical protein
MAASLSMGYETFRDWLVRHPELREVVQIEKAVADQRVVESLFLRATGYTRQAQRPLIDRAGRPVVVSFEEAVPPDVVAQMFWLKNRQRDLWTDTVNHVLAISTSDDLKAARERVVQNPPTDGAALLPYMVANSIESPHLSAINATSTPRLSASACAVNDDLDVP